MDIFNFIENTFLKRQPVKSKERQLDDTESYYMACRWLSMAPLGLSTAWSASRLSMIPRWGLGCLIYHRIKKQKSSPPLNYIKKTKESKTASKEEIMKKIMIHYHCSRTHAEQILKIYEVNNKNIYNCFGVKK